MAKGKIAITLDKESIEELDRLVNEHVFQSRSHAIRQAVSEKLLRLKRNRLAAECAKLDEAFEKAMAEEGESMAAILRGEIRWADLNPTRGRERAGLRPVLILSHNIFNERSGTVIAVAITSKLQKGGFPLTIALKSGDLPKQLWVKISQIRTLSVERIGKPIGAASQREMAQVIEGLNEVVA